MMTKGHQGHTIYGEVYVHVHVHVHAHLHMHVHVHVLYDEYTTLNNIC